MRLHIGRKQNNLLSGAQTTTYWKKEAKTHTPVYISGAEVNGFRLLGISITENLSWSSSISTLVKRAQKQLYFIRKLKRAKFPCQVLVNFYRGAPESILAGNISDWHGLCMAQDRRALQKSMGVISINDSVSDCFK